MQPQALPQQTKNNMKSFFDKINDNPVYKWGVFAGGAIIIFLLGVLATSIIQRRTEAEFVYTP